MQIKNSGFKTRLISSILIILYFLIFFLISALGDMNNYWSPIPKEYRHIFAWFLIVFFIPIIIFANIEINSIYFKNEKNKLIMAIILSLAIVLSPMIIMICINYNFYTPSNKTFIFLLSIFISFILSSVVIGFYLYWLKMRHHEIFIYLFLYQIFNFFIVSFSYLALIKSWSTLLIVFLLPVLTDTFAYLGGALFGKRKLAPYTSHKKTIEGAIIGVLFAVGITLIILTIYAFSPIEHNMLKNFLGVNFIKRFDTVLPDHNFANKPLWWINTTIILLFLSIFSIIGDLSFSGVKRKYQIKDFSNLIPGHGGILDRIDSHTFVFSLYFIITIGIGFFAETVGVF